MLVFVLFVPFVVLISAFFTTKAQRSQSFFCISLCTWCSLCLCGLLHIKSNGLKPGKGFVVSFHQKIDAQKSKNQHHKTDNGHDGRASPPPPHGQPSMKQNGIKQPGNSCPYLFGIPAPETAPNRFGIDKAGDQAQGEHGKADEDTDVSDVIQHF